MIKTSIKKPAKFKTFSRALLAYGISRQYLTQPAWFVVQTLLTLGRFKRTLPSDVSKEFAETVALEAWMYLRLKEKLGQDKAFALMRAVMIPVAMVRYGAGFRIVEAPRTYENIIRFHEMLYEKMLTEDGNLKIDEHNDSRYTYRNFFCPWNDLFRKLGIPELTEPYCAIDNGLYNTYLPGEIIFHRGGVNRTIASGAPYCQYIYEHHK